MTNREWLNGLDDRKIVELIVPLGCECKYCIIKTNCDHVLGNCYDKMAEWLKQTHKKPMPELQVGDVLTSDINRTFIVVHRDYAYDSSDERIDSLNWVLGVYTIVDVSRVDINGKCQSIWRADNDL